VPNLVLLSLCGAKEGYDRYRFKSSWKPRHKY